MDNGPSTQEISAPGIDQRWRRNILLFLASQTVSLFGSSLVQYAIMWYITLKTQSGVMMTLSIVSGFLPTFFLSPFAGVWADRYSRKTLIVLSDTLIAVCALILALVFLAGHELLWMLFLMSAVRALGTAIQTPAVGAFIPQLVPEDQLMKVNATNGSLQALVMLVSPMVSGALLTFSTIETIFFIDVFTALLAVLTLLLFLHVPVHAKARQKQTTSYFRDLRDGVAYIKTHGFLRHYFLFCTLFFVLIAPAAFLTPLQVTRTFGDDVWRLTAIEIAFSLGMMAGGLFMASWGGFRNKIHTMTLASLLNGACVVALGSVAAFWLYLVFMGLVGVTIPFFNTPATVLLQEKVKPDYLGRVFGVLGMISSAMMPVGMLVFGPLADFVRIEWILILTGLALSVQGFSLIGNRVLVEAGQPVRDGDG